MDAREHVPVKSMLAEVLYDARDANSRKIILDRGIKHDVTLGLPVIDNQGVVGQVTRVFPFTSEVTTMSPTWMSALGAVKRSSSAPALPRP